MIASFLSRKNWIEIDFSYPLENPEEPNIKVGANAVVLMDFPEGYTCGRSSREDH